MIFLKIFSSHSFTIVKHNNTYKMNADFTKVYPVRLNFIIIITTTSENYFIIGGIHLSWK